jgi:TatD DNase family protein
LKVPYIDIHTHHSLNSEEILGVQSLFLQDLDFQSIINTPFSAAIHPWHASKYESKQVGLLLEKLINQPNLIAIGETGLDKICPANYMLQKEVFELHLAFAEKLDKPMIIHAVKSWNDLTGYLKSVKVPCILHGYSEGVVLTKQLINMGCYFSLGKSILQASPRIKEAIEIIPVASLFLETDDSHESIKEIYREVSQIVNLSLESLKNQVYSNFRALFYG